MFFGSHETCKRATQSSQRLANVVLPAIGPTCLAAKTQPVPRPRALFRLALGMSSIWPLENVSLNNQLRPGSRCLGCPFSFCNTEFAPASNTDAALETFFARLSQIARRIIRALERCFPPHTMYASSPLFMVTIKTSSSAGTSGHGDENFGLPQRRKTFSVKVSMIALLLPLSSYSLQKTRLLNDAGIPMSRRAFTTDDVCVPPRASRTSANISFRRRTIHRL